MHNLLRLLFSKNILLLISISSSTLIVYAQSKNTTTLYETPTRIFGLTIDESSLDEEKLQTSTEALIDHIIEELRNLKKTNPTNHSLTVRIVLPVGCENNGDCDTSEPKVTNKLDKKYSTLLKRIKDEDLANIMAEIIDSDISSSSACFTLSDEVKSVRAYVERTEKLYNKLGKYVDIWEIGNEINGDWYGCSVNGIIKNEQRRKIVVLQLKGAYDFLTAKKLEIIHNNNVQHKQDKVPLTALTFYFNGDGKKRNSYENINDAMLRWIKGIGPQFLDAKKNKISFYDLDYLLISYYPDDNFYEPNPEESDFGIQIKLTAKEWVEVFDAVRTNYSSTTKFGFGEVGTQCYFSNKNIDCNQSNDCKTLRVDLLKNKRNPCNKYDKQGEIIESRNCSCCHCAQVRVMQEYYTELDREIYNELKIAENFKNADRFIGGYFNWYYSEDVINKTIHSNTIEKTQAEKVRNAIIDSYKTFIR